VPVSAPAREGAAQPTPRAPSCPRSFPADDQVATLALPTHSSPAPRVFCSRSLCAGSARAWRAEGAPLKIRLMARPGHADVAQKWHSSARMACQAGSGMAAASL
jgi:hypothetical protein